MEHSRDHRVKADLQAVQQEAMQARRACSAVQQAKHLQELFLKRYNNKSKHTKSGNFRLETYMI